MRLFQARTATAMAMLVAVVFSFTATSFSQSKSQQTGLLGAGTTWETPWHIVDSGIDGPVVLVTGGIHGNEPAGFHAARQIQQWPIVKGKLIILPQLNRLGLAADTRWTPEFRNDRKLRDLNRTFPHAKTTEPKTPLSLAVWNFVCEQKPDWHFDLHEGFDFHRVNPKSVGSSVIGFPQSNDFASAIVDSINKTTKPDRQFDLLTSSGPANGSLARACTEQLGTNSFIFETTTKNQPISLRTRQHRVMVSASLRRIGVIEKDCTHVLSPNGNVGTTRVAVFDDNGANESAVLKVINGHQDLTVCHVGPRDMTPEILNQFDVVIFPGGSGSKQGRAIGETRREHVRQYVREGGGVIGICAGAYLCSSHYSWSLDLVNAAVFNKSFEIPGKGRKSMWYRGPSANVEVEFNDQGTHVFAKRGVHLIRYQNGPILSAGSNSELPDFKTLASFRTENGIYQQQKDTMTGTPAIIESQFGKGRVLAISPHFESTKGYHDVVLLGIEHVRRIAKN